MNKIIGLKELRENVNTYISGVQKGVTYIVVKRSKPIFKISSFDEDDDSNWEVISDFTQIKKGGVPIEDVLAKL